MPPLPPTLTRPLALLGVAACVAFSQLPQGAPAEAAQPRGGIARVAVDTPHYRIFSQLPPALTREMADELEACHADYSRRLSVFNDTARLAADRGQYDVQLFLTAAAYGRFTGNDIPNSAGLFYPHLRTLCAYVEGQGPAEMKRTIRHEAFHQFADRVLGPTLPQWLNEGLAQVFEHGIRVGGRLEMGQLPPAALREIQAVVRAGETIEFAEMLSLDNRRWNEGMTGRRRANVQYAQSWAMTHFLIYATGDRGEPLYRGRFNAMLGDVARGIDGTAAFRRHFGDNLAGFRRKFEAWVLAQRPTATAAALDEQATLGEMLLLLHKQGRAFTDAQQFGRYLVRSQMVLTRTRNGTVSRSAPDPGVYFRDVTGAPLSPLALRFEEADGPLPTLVRHPGDGRVYETRYHSVAGELWAETTCRYE